MATIPEILTELVRFVEESTYTDEFDHMIRPSAESKQYATATATEQITTQQREKVEKLKEVLKRKSSRAYCDALNQASKFECLGWEAKVKAGKFGKAELDAHGRVQELLGRHRALADVAALKELEATDA